MKTNQFLPLMAALLMAPSALLAQNTATTTPVGYVTQEIRTGTFNVIGFNLMTPALTTGSVTSISTDGLTINDTAANLTSSLPANKTYSVEIISGAAIGYVFQFNTWSQTSITLGSAIPGLDVGAKYIVRANRTLQELFPSGAPLTGAALTPTNADIVWVPNGSGGYTQYWYKTNAAQGAIGWWTTNDGTTRGSLVSTEVPLLFTDAILVQRKSAATTSLVISGEIKKTSSNPLVNTGFNLVSINPPSGLSLFTAGFFPNNFAGAALTPVNADILWVPNGTGAYTQYWYKTNASQGAIGWWTTADGTTRGAQVTEDVQLPAGCFIQRKGTARFMSINVPAFFSGL